MLLLTTPCICMHACLSMTRIRKYLHCLTAHYWLSRVVGSPDRGVLNLQAYEINNAVAHLLQNTGNLSRIHLIIDAAEQTRPERILLRPGQQCVYKGRRIQC